MLGILLIWQYPPLMTKATPPQTYQMSRFLLIFGSSPVTLRQPCSLLQSRQLVPCLMGTSRLSQQDTPTKLALKTELPSSSRVVIRGHSKSEAKV